jgi:hypothetical protein
MQATSNTFRTARSTRLAAALAGVLVSATLLGSVVLAFDHQAGAAVGIAQTPTPRIG